MEKIKKDLNDCNKEILNQFTGLYYKITNNFDKSYFYGKKAGYEEMLTWFKSYQNNSIKFISPKSVKSYLTDKGSKSKNSLSEKKNIKDKDDSSKRINKANFNYLFYNQTFNIDNNHNRNKIEYNVYPTSVENAFNKNSNKSLNPFNFIVNNKNKDEYYHLSLLANPSMKSNNQNNNINNSFSFFNNNKINDSIDEQMKPINTINNNFYTDTNLKRKKNN